VGRLPLGAASAREIADAAAGVHRGSGTQSPSYSPVLRGDGTSARTGAALRALGRGLIRPLCRERQSLGVLDADDAGGLAPLAHLLECLAWLAPEPIPEFLLEVDIPEAQSSPSQRTTSAQKMIVEVGTRQRKLTGTLGAGVPSIFQEKMLI